MKDCKKYTQVKYSNMNYMQQIHVLHSIFQLYHESQNIYRYRVCCKKSHWQWDITEQKVKKVTEFTIK